MKLLLPVCTLFAVLQLTTSASIRGVPPSLHRVYDASSDAFKCLDGSKSLPWSRINDDYCDCVDGSDEPDCCDGTDEQQGCKNICKQAGSAARHELASKAKEYAAGAKTRQKYISQFQTSRQTWQQDLDKVKKDLGPQQELVDKAKADKEAAEAEEKDRKAAEQAAKQEQEGTMKQDDTVNTGDQSVLQEAADAGITADPLAANAATEVSADDDASAGEDEEVAEEQEQEEGPSSVSEATTDSLIQPDQTVDTGSQHVLKEEEKELSADEMGRKIASQWTTDPEAAGSAQIAAPTSDATSQEDIDASTAASEGAAAFFAGQPSLEALTENIKSRAAAMWDLGKDWVSDKLGTSAAASLSGKTEGSSEVKALQDKFFKHNSRLSELQNLQRDLEAKMKHDYGPEGVFGALVDKCFETKDAHQKENAMKTSLGNWAGLEDNHTVMKFTGGQGCWQGPARSMTVSVVCGSTEKLSKVQEPSRCEYVAELSTPAACTSGTVEALQAKLAALESDDEHVEL